LLLVIGSCIATLVAQRLALGNTQNLPMESRVSNALISYIVYLRQMFWPTDLIPFYIHPENRLAFWQPLGAAIVLIGVSAGTFLLRKTRPYLFVGWHWYLRARGRWMKPFRIGNEASRSGLTTPRRVTIWQVRSPRPAGWTKQSRNGNKHLHGIRTTAMPQTTLRGCSRLPATTPYVMV